MRLFRSQVTWILPLVLLLLALVQDIVTYKLRQYVPNVYARAAVIFVFTAFIVGVAAGWLGPRIRNWLSTARQHTRSIAGKLGLVAFYVVAYGATYYAYVVVERYGSSAGLLPASVR